MNENDIKSESLGAIAETIRKDWKNPYFGAKPYLEALACLDNIKDKYGADDGESVVAYFLSNATKWRGPVARMVKKELQRRLKAA